MGSGKAILRAINKYGKDKFTKDILEYFDSRVEVFAAERKIVNEDFVKKRNNYNLQTGGLGSTSCVPSKETRLKQSLSKQGKKNGMFGRKNSDQAKRLISKANKGLKRSEQQKENMRKTPRIRSSCVFCKLETINTNIIRWHGDNCKERRSLI